MPEQLADIHLVSRAGDAVVVEMRSMSGGGYLWQPGLLPDGCIITPLASAPGSGLGSGTTQRFELHCDKPGTWRLVFQLKRPWENDVQAERTVELQIE